MPVDIEHPYKIDGIVHDSILSLKDFPPKEKFFLKEIVLDLSALLDSEAHGEGRELEMEIPIIKIMHQGQGERTNISLPDAPCSLYWWVLSVFWPECLECTVTLS